MQLYLPSSQIGCAFGLPHQKPSKEFRRTCKHETWILPWHCWHGMLGNVILSWKKVLDGSVLWVWPGQTWKALGITETAGAAGPQENVAKQNGRLFHVSQTRYSIKKIRKCKFKRPIISRTLPIFSHIGPWWSMAPWWSHHGYHTGTKLITSMTCWELNPPCRT